jgi:uncharacterized protein YeaO (DUF488 family)
MITGLNYTNPDIYEVKIDMGILKIKRIYEPAEIEDGTRILVDGLWPRGISKEKATLYKWVREISPSKDLRNWFKHIPERYDEFSTRYTGELEASDVAKNFSKEVERLLDMGDVTLLYGSKDQNHNNALVLQKWLERSMD